MAMHTHRNIAALSWPALAVALAGASASGQTAPLDIVDQQVEDVSPLAVSLRESQTSLRQPADFGRVYRFQDDSNRLARAQGGLYAVFPRSVYAPDKPATDKKTGTSAAKKDAPENKKTPAKTPRPAKRAVGSRKSLTERLAGFRSKKEKQTA